MIDTMLARACPRELYGHGAASVIDHLFSIQFIKQSITCKNKGFSHGTLIMIGRRWPSID